MSRPFFIPTRLTTYGLFGTRFNICKADKMLPLCDGSGISCQFYTNGAEENTNNEYAVKVYESQADAIGSYQRQVRAQRFGVAAPVGKLLMIEREGKCPLYGYETGLCSPLPDDLFNEIHNAMNTDWYSQFKVSSIVRLRRALRRVNLSGTILNDVFKYDTTIGDLPIYVPDGSPLCLGGDLHSHNYKMWKGKLVCIDFGAHSVLTSSVGRPAQLINWDVPSCRAARKIAESLGVRLDYNGY